MTDKLSNGRRLGNVVLVHGGFVDGSEWESVYRELKDQGYNVTIVQNPTISLADDVAVTKRAIAAQDGPVVLVGHSYGGAVITEAGNDPKVAALKILSKGEGAPVARSGWSDLHCVLLTRPRSSRLSPISSGPAEAYALYLFKRD